MTISGGKAAPSGHGVFQHEVLRRRAGLCLARLTIVLGDRFPLEIILARAEGPSRIFSGQRSVRC
jgi:hypothetical protein